jgi:hypothetical protein
VLRQLLAMRGEDDGTLKPDPSHSGGYLASSRSALRRFFMTFSAARI